MSMVKNGTSCLERCDGVLPQKAIFGPISKSNFFGPMWMTLGNTGKRCCVGNNQTGQDSPSVLMLRERNYFLRGLQDNKFISKIFTGCFGILVFKIIWYDGSCGNEVAEEQTTMDKFEINLNVDLNKTSRIWKCKTDGQFTV